MTEGEKTSLYPEIIAKAVRANGRDNWTPVRYSMLYAYVAMYHKVRGNPQNYGLTEDGLKNNSNPNQVIFEKVKERFGQLWSDLGLEKMGHLMDKTEMYKDLDNLDSHARDLSSAFTLDGKLDAGKMMTMENANMVMRIKEDKCREKFMTIKIAADYTPNLIESKDGKDKNGYTGAKYREANRMREEKVRPYRRAWWKMFAMGALALVAGAGAVVGLGALIGSGGALLTGMFGGLFSAAGVGTAVAGLAGTIVGGLLTKTFIGRWIMRRAEAKKLKQEYKDFMRGEGKYVTKDGKANGYRKIKEQRHDQLIAKAVMSTIYTKFYNSYMKERNLDKEAVVKIGATTKTYPGGYKELQDRKFKLTTQGTLTDIEKQELAAISDKIKEYKVSESDFINAYDKYLRTNTAEINEQLKKVCEKINEKGLRKLDIRDYIRRTGLGEIAKETVFNSQVSDTIHADGVMTKVRSILSHEVSWADEINNETVFEKKQNIENAIINASTEADKLKAFNSLMNAYETLELQKEEFTKQNSQSQYINLKRKLCDAIVQNIRSIVDSPYNNETLKFINDALQENSKSLEAIKNSSQNGDFEELQGLATFVNKETSMFNPNLGVTIKEQLNFDKNSIESGCKRLGIPAGKEATLDDIIDRISRLDVAVDSVVNAINHDIEINFSGSIKTYLLHMLNTKKKIAKVDTSTIVDSNIRNAINNLTGPNDANIEGIRKKIESDLTGSAKTKAQELLDAQIAALALKQKYDNTAGAFEAVKNLKDGTIIDYYKTISEIEEYSEGFDGGKLITFKSKLDKIQDPNLREYMVMKLNEKVEKIYSDYAKSRETTFSSSTEEISKFIKKVNESQLLTKAQKNNIIAQVGKSLDAALSSKMRNIYEGLFSGDTKISAAQATASGLVVEYSKYLTESMFGTNIGFKEYLNSGTPEAEALKQKIEYFKKTINAVPSFLSTEGKYGKQAAVFDGQSSDSRLFLRTFYGGKERKEGDKLFDTATKINAIYDHIEGSSAFDVDPNNLLDSMYKVEETDAFGRVTRASGTLAEMKDVLNEISNSTEMDEEDKLAALIILKKKCVGIFRAQMARNIYGHGEGTELNDYIISQGGALAESQLENYNEILFNEVDAKIAELGGGTVRGIKDEIREGLTSAAKYQGLVNNPGMSMG